MSRLETLSVWSLKVLKLTITSSFSPGPERKLCCPSHRQGNVEMSHIVQYTRGTGMSWCGDGCGAVLLRWFPLIHHQGSTRRALSRLSTRYCESKLTFEPHLPHLNPQFSLLGRASLGKGHELRVLSVSFMSIFMSILCLLYSCQMGFLSQLVFL